MNTKDYEKAQIIAQHWFYSCDAPDITHTSQEIDRLAKMIVEGLEGKNLEWRVINHDLFTTKTKKEIIEKMKQKTKELEKYSAKLPDHLYAESPTIQGLEKQLAILRWVLSED